MKKLIVAVGAVGIMLSLSACDFGETKQSTPDPTSDNIRMSPPKEVTGMPAGFRNVAQTCNSFGDMIYVTSRGSDFAGGPNGGGLGSGVFVVPAHPACKR